MVKFRVYLTAVLNNLVISPSIISELLIGQIRRHACLQSKAKYTLSRNWHVET